MTWHGHVERNGDADCVKACARLVMEGDGSCQNTLSADMRLL